MNSTETMCVLAGASAIGAMLFYNQSQGASRRGYGPSECSARRATVEPSSKAGVSARAASTDADASSQGDVADVKEFAFMDSLFATDKLSDGFEEQFASLPAKRARAPSASRQMMAEHVQTNNSRVVGKLTLLPGRSAEGIYKPKVSEGCAKNMLFMTEPMAEQLLTQSSSAAS